MNDRHTADTITDDALDALYEQLDARDAALATYTAQLQRDQAALDRVRAVLADQAALDWRQRIRDAIDEQPAPEPCDGRPCAGTGCSHEQAAAALTAHDEAAGLYTAPAPAATEATTGHVYLSTGCLHGHHDYCQNHTGLSGQKTPATCKFCGAPCICGCHQHHMTRPADQPKEQRERPTHPDGTPYRYHEINAEGWEHCDGCGLWGQWTVANPHECANDRVQPTDQPKDQ